MRDTILSATFLISLFFTHSPLADVATYRFWGEVSFIEEQTCLDPSVPFCSEVDAEQVDSSNFFPRHVFSVGDPVFAQVTWDPDTLVSEIVLNGDQALHDGAVVQSRFLSGEFALPSDDFAVPSGERLYDTFGAIQNDAAVNNGGDLFIFGQRFVSADWSVAADVSLFDPSGTVFDSFALPAAIDFADFGSGSIVFRLFESATQDQLFVAARLTSLAPIPIPSAVFLFASALGLAGWIRRKIS